MADDGRAEPEVEEPEEDRQRADERPQAVLARPELADDDRRDDEPRDERHAVDGVDERDVAAEEAQALAAVQGAHALDDAVGPALDRVRLDGAAAELFADRGARAVVQRGKLAERR